MSNHIEKHTQSLKRAEKDDRTVQNLTDAPMTIFVAGEKQQQKKQWKLKSNPPPPKKKKSNNNNNNKTTVLHLGRKTDKRHTEDQETIDLRRRRGREDIMKIVYTAHVCRHFLPAEEGRNGPRAGRCRKEHNIHVLLWKLWCRRELLFLTGEEKALYIFAWFMLLLI